MSSAAFAPNVHPCCTDLEAHPSQMFLLACGFSFPASTLLIDPYAFSFLDLPTNRWQMPVKPNAFLRSQEMETLRATDTTLVGYGSCDPPIYAYTSQSDHHLYQPPRTYYTTYYRPYQYTNNALSCGRKVKVVFRARGLSRRSLTYHSLSFDC
jgi:hypothetical protein